MKFFNIDLHVSVIRDIKTIFNELGHSVDTFSLSGHNWVFKNENIQRPDILNESNWHDISEEALERFYKHYKDKLDEYDGFIVTHTPVLAKFYERFNKPIIVVASTRYEHPFTDDKEQWKKLNTFFETNENLILTSNNLFDKYYCEMFINKKFKFIESICSYTNAKYAPSINKGVVYSKFDIKNLTGFINKNSLGRVSWQDLYKHKCIAHFPYNVSTMSIFEQYCANVPLLFPSKEFTKTLLNNSFPLYSELSYRAVKRLPPKSLFGIENDPNIYNVQNILDSLEYADFYRFKNALYFDSLEELQYKFNNTNFDMVSFHMMQENMERMDNTLQSWKETLEGINA